MRPLPAQAQEVISMAAQPEYPKETVVAEKLEALTALGLLNSRMKDFYDLLRSADAFSDSRGDPFKALWKPGGPWE